MGMNSKSIGYFFDILKVTGMQDFSKISVCILGSQVIRRPSRKVPGYDYTFFKDLLVGHEFMKVESIDINGKGNSLVMDLSCPLDPEMVGRFDVVHNAGTTEHILHNQWQVFKNIHDLLKPCGVIFHGSLPPERLRGHGFWAYDEKFYRWLVKACLYKIVDIQVGMTSYFKFSERNTFFFTMQKEVNSKFVDEGAWRNPVYEDKGVGHFVSVMDIEYDTYVKSCLRSNLL